jgi:polyhydroxybutyrate depolymerase
MLRAMRRWISLALVAGCGSSQHGEIDAPPTGDGPPDVPTIDAGPCGVRTNNRGLTHRMMTLGGLNRTYLVYLPDVDAKTPIPFVGVFHGYTMSGQNMYDATEYAKLADTEHIALVFPDGEAGPSSLGAPWNVGTNLCPSVAGPPPSATGDDFAFLDAMKADVAQDQCLDESHVYVTGFSMGGYFSHHTGCMRPDIRAVAPHSGGTHDLAGCPSTHKPIIIFHGTSDGVIPDGCDDPAGTTPSGFTASAAAWAAKNGCGTTTTTMAVDNGQCITYDNCPADGQVVLCTFNNMGHCWAGGPSSAGVYSCPGYASATQLEWQFFKQYAW